MATVNRDRYLFYLKGIIGINSWIKLDVRLKWEIWGMAVRLKQAKSAYSPRRLFIASLSDLYCGLEADLSWTRGRFMASSTVLSKQSFRAFFSSVFNFESLLIARRICSRSPLSFGSFEFIKSLSSVSISLKYPETELRFLPGDWIWSVSRFSVDSSGNLAKSAVHSKQSWGDAPFFFKWL